MPPLKRNRKIALRLADKQQGRSVQREGLELKPHTVREVYMEEWRSRSAW